MIQTSDKSAIETVLLTNALGWNSPEDVQKQQDVHEFFQDFLSILESLLEFTSQSNVINEVYTGNQLFFA